MQFFILQTQLIQSQSSIILTLFQILQTELMIESNKEERDIIFPILQQLDIDNKDPVILSQLMHGLGFENDVPFAKSLFSDTLTHIYKLHQGLFEKFLANDNITKLHRQSKELFFAIIRLYHQHKITEKQKAIVEKQTEQKQLTPLTMPDPKNINQIIKFQKKMYQVFKHLLPPTNQLNNNNQHPYFPPPQFADMNNYAPFSMCPERSFRQYQNQFFPSIQNPYVPSFATRSFASSNLPADEQQRQTPFFTLNRSQPYIQRQSIFSRIGPNQIKKQSESLGQFEAIVNQNRDIIQSSSHPQQQQKNCVGFTAFNEIDTLGQPSKKIKTQSGNTCPTGNIENIRAQLALYKRNQSKNKEIVHKTEKQTAEKDDSTLIKKSVSEYIDDGVTLNAKAKETPDL